MSEQFAARIKNFLKDNIVGFVFLIIIAFFGFSVWINTQSSTQQVADLTNFADQSLPQIRTKFQSISQRSTFDSHTDEQYQQVIADFQDLDQLLQNLSQTIPTQSNDQTSDALENELRSFFWQTRVEIVSRWIEMLKARQNLIDQYNLSATLKTTVENGDAAQLQNVVDAARAVAEFERENVDLIQDLSAQKSKSEELEKDLEKLGVIQGILNRTPEGASISSESRDQIAQLYAESGWPMEISIFPQISVDDLETAEFTSTVLTLRNLVIELRQKYPVAVDE